MANAALNAFTLDEYFAKIQALAKYALGEIVTFNSGCVHVCNGAVAHIEKIDLDHTHGGSVANPWWARHNKTCFSRDHIEYSLVLNPRADGSADLRWKACEREIS